MKSRKGKSVSRMYISGYQGLHSGGNKGPILMGMGLIFLDNENAMDSDDGGICTHLCMY